MNEKDLRGLFISSVISDHIDNNHFLPTSASINREIIIKQEGYFRNFDLIIAVIEKNKIHFNHNNEFAVEYINSKEGIRQNFIIDQSPADKPSTLNIKLSTNKGWFINKVHSKEIHFAKTNDNGSLS